MPTTARPSSRCASVSRECRSPPARGNVDIVLAHGDRFGPLEAVSTPGHAPDHFAFVSGPVAMTGDAVLGEGSVFIAPDPGALVGYLRGLEELRGRSLELLCPGHGPPVRDPRAKLDEYISHRLDREQRLVAALDGGARTVQEMLDAAWDDVPAAAASGRGRDARRPSRQARRRRTAARRGRAPRGVRALDLRQADGRLTRRGAGWRSSSPPPAE